MYRAGHIDASMSLLMLSPESCALSPAFARVPLPAFAALPSSNACTRPGCQQIRLHPQDRDNEIKTQQVCEMSVSTGQTGRGAGRLRTCSSACATSPWCCFPWFSLRALSPGRSRGLSRSGHARQEQDTANQSTGNIMCAQIGGAVSTNPARPDLT
jgi:hypothetical protein